MKDLIVSIRQTIVVDYQELRRRRLARGLTIKRLSELSGISQTRLQQIENSPHRGGVTEDTFTRLVDVLNAHPEKNCCGSCGTPGKAKSDE